MQAVTCPRARRGRAYGLVLTLLAAAAGPAVADAGDAGAVAARASLSGTVLGLPIEILDESLSEVHVAQGDEDEEATETLLSIDLPILGPVPLVTADVVSSTASSNHERAQASSFLSDVSVNLPLGALPTVLTLDAIESSAICHIVEAPVGAVEPPISVTLLGVLVDVELDEDIEVDIGIASAVLRIGHIEETADSATATGLTLALEVDILGLASVDLDLTIAESMCERGIPVQPVAAALDPPSGPETGGTLVTITGHEFVPGYTTVTIGTVTVPAGDVEVIDATTLEFTTPPHAPGFVDVTVGTPGGASTPPLTFEYVPVGPGQPVALALDPDNGPESGGTLVTIIGDGFVPDETAVHIGGNTVPADQVNVIDATTLEFTTPPHVPGTVDVTVETPGGVSDPPLGFEYVPDGPGQPVTTVLDPDSGPESGGTIVTITGDGFVPDETVVHIGGAIVPADQVNVIDATTLEFTTPPHVPGIVDVTVETPGGVSDPPLAFEYLPDGTGQPVATALDPDSGPESGGTLVTITGDGFVADETAVHIGGNTVPADAVNVIDATTLEFTTPAHVPGVVEVTVETPGGVSDPPLEFEYLPDGPGQPVATALDPDSGPESGGTLVTITGGGFIVGQTAVNIGGNIVPPNEVDVIDATTLQFTTPPHAPGVVDVTVATLGGVSDPPLAFEYLPDDGIDERVPTALDVDFAPNISDGNTVFEPGERVDVAPVWLNDGPDTLDLTGAASEFAGPPGPDYGLVDAGADYGVVDPGATASCRDTDDCYVMEGGPQGVPRPGQHWDTVFDETLSEDTAYTWTLHIGDSFLDMPRTSGYYRSVETIVHHNVTAGCTVTEFCPLAPNSRGQMAPFVLRSLEGPDYQPEPCTSGTELFDDVSAAGIFCAWIEELARRQVVGGCDENNYCPGDPVSRAQMSIFLLKTLEGPGYIPPTCSGLFEDVQCPSIFADWIEELFNRGITVGCVAEPSLYCPAESLTRRQMAVFLTRTFGLQLYGP